MTEIGYRDLGTIDYIPCWSEQERLFASLLEQKGEGRSPEQAGWLLLCEHPHVYTLGKSGHAENLLIDEDRLRKLGAEFHRIDRGGDITYHGPGQLVGYPILDLERFGLGLKDYIHALEQVVIETAGDFGIRGERIDGATGVWVEGGGRPLRKLCAIGVRSSRFITMHGFALNVNTDLRYFSYINPCGFTDRGVTSIASETGSPVAMVSVKESLIGHMEKIMNCKIIK